MAFTEKTSDGVFNGTNAVDLVPAPAASTRRIVRSIYVFNNDTVTTTVTLRLNNNGALRVIARAQLQPNEALEFVRTTVLDATNKKIDGVLAASSTTAAPTFVCTFADAT
jgi:hypothetical protein